MWKEDSLKGMMVFQMTAAATVINNMLHTPTCGWFFFFFTEKMYFRKHSIFV
jgi:hypothetical protein